MFIIVNHEIRDAAAFWGRAQEALPSLPANIRIHGVFPGTDGARATCLWEADTMENMREYLESQVGDVSRNEYMEVAQATAMGLPA